MNGITVTESDFIEFPKIARLSRECVITEKLDGTNAQVFVRDDGLLLFGSRTRWITPDADNYGFARWGTEHADELRKLGPGRHFGEWWGKGIQRGYGQTEKRFSLFNVIRWCLHGEEPTRITTADPRIEKYQDVLPPCVGLVPLLWRGEFLSPGQVDYQIARLRDVGSQAALGFMNPEGIIVFHLAGNVGFKKTLHNDQEPKSKAA